MPVLKKFRQREKGSWRRHTRYLLLLFVATGLLAGLLQLVQASLYAHQSSGQASFDSPIGQLEGSFPFSARPELSSVSQNATIRAAEPCAPFDPPCYVGQFGTFVADWLFEAMRPFLEELHKSPTNFITYTDPGLTYEHEVVEMLAGVSVTTVDLSLAALVALVGYSLMLGPGMSLVSTELLSLLPRLVLAVIAAHNWQLICGLLIDLGNALTVGMMAALDFTLLTDLLEILFRQFTGTGLPTSPLFLLLSLTLTVQILFLIWQMLVRLALVLLCLALSPLGLISFALPLTQHWGQVWLSSFSHAVFIQFIQVTALALGGMLVSSFLSKGFFGFDADLISFFVSNAVFYLVHQLPGMLREYSLRPITQAGQDTWNLTLGVVNRARRTII